MQEDFDSALEMDVLTAALRMDKQQAHDLLEYLAQKFQACLPDSTTVKRGGWMLSADRPVEQLTIRFPDYHFQLDRPKHGPVSAKVMKIVRGVVLKTTEIPTEEWTKQLAETLSEAAKQNAATRDALQKLIM
jgi:hypothetical protein